MSVPLELKLRRLAELFAATETWQERANCRGIDTNLFYPEQHSFNAQSHNAAVKAVCGMCEVREECLDYALRAHEQHGLWGGMSLKERRRLRADGAA